LELDLYAKIADLVAENLNVPESYAKILRKALSTPEEIKASKTPIGKKISSRRFRSQEWILRATLVARKLFIEGRKDESFAILGLALYNAYEKMGGKSFSRTSYNETSTTINQSSMKKIIESSSDEASKNFKPSLSYIRESILKGIKQTKDYEDFLRKASKLTALMILAVTSEPDMEIRNIARKCLNLKNELGKSAVVKRYNKLINAISVGIIVFFLATTYFNVTIGIISLVAGTLFLSIFLKRKQDYVNRQLKEKQEKCLSLNDEAAEHLLNP
jgi:hypothetical protein